MAALRILIVDDHAVLRSALRMVLEREPGVRVVGDVGTAEDAVAAVQAQHVDLVLLDLRMPGMGGLAGVGALQRARPGVAVLVLSMHDEVDDVRRALAAGASGYVLKTAADEQLVEAVRTVAGGERYLQPSLGAAMARPQPARRADADALTARERDVLRLLAMGYTHREIGAELGLSVRTVETHRAHVMAKLRTGTRAAMVQRAMAAGLVAAPETPAVAAPR